MDRLAGLKNFLSNLTEMSSSRPEPREGYPAVPPTLNHDDLNNYRSDRDIPHNTIPYYTPYLGLRARLSQVWINRWTVLLALILVRLILTIGDLNYNVGRAKEEALQACTSVESIGSAMASMPHYLSEGVNALAADGITNAVHALMRMLTMTVTGVEEIILFVINMMTSTYVCLITLAISGSMQAAIEMIQRVGKFVNETIGDITNGMTDTIGGFEDNLNSFLGKINIPSLFGKESDPPSIDLSSQITALKNIKIDPTEMNAELTKLNASIPNFAQVNNFTNSVIRAPFEFVKEAIDAALPNYAFNKSVFEPAPKQALTFCSENSVINDFFDALFKLLQKIKTIGLAVLIILAVLVCAPMAYREIWRWRRLQERANLLQKNAFDPIDVVHIASRPYTNTIGIKLASMFSSTKRQILTRWFVAYATSGSAMFVLALGLAGAFSCLCQYVVLKSLEKEVPGLAKEAGKFSGDVVGALNNASMAWAVSANGVITSTNDKVNKDVFGWIDVSTTSINDTLNKFTSEMSKELDNMFGDTPLKDPIKEVLNCLIGLKIAGFQKAITWVHDNAHIDFPEFRPDIFSLGAAASLTDSSSDDSFLASPGSIAGDRVTDAVYKVSNKLQDQIRTDAIISACVIGVWLLIVLCGLARVLVGMFGRDKTRAEGGPVGYTGDDRQPISPRSPAHANQFPQFGGPVSSVGPVSSSEDVAWGAGALGDEKVRSTGHRSVEASYKPGHDRVSSYGHVSEKR